MQITAKNQYMTVAELAKKLGISRVAVFQKVKRGQIPAEMIGGSYVIRMEDVEYFLETQGGALTEEGKREIDAAVGRVVKDYGEALKLLGKE